MFDSSIHKEFKLDRCVSQKYLCKKGHKLYVAFVNFKKAFDSVHHGKVLNSLCSGHQGQVLLWK